MEIINNAIMNSSDDQLNRVDPASVPCVELETIGALPILRDSDINIAQKVAMRAKRAFLMIVVCAGMATQLSECTSFVQNTESPLPKGSECALPV